MEGSAAARGEGSSEEKKETAPLKRARQLFAPQLVPKLAPQLVPQFVPQLASSPISAEERKDYEDRGNSIPIRQDDSSATITTAESTEPEPTVEEQYNRVIAMMKEKAEAMLRRDRKNTNNTGGGSPQRREGTQ